MNDSPQAAGDAIRAYRREHGLTQEDLAARLGMSAANLSRIEQGEQPIGESLLPKFIAETGLAANVLRPDLAELFKADVRAQERAAGR